MTCAAEAAVRVVGRRDLQTGVRVRAHRQATRRAMAPRPDLSDLRGPDWQNTVYRLPPATCTKRRISEHRLRPRHPCRPARRLLVLHRRHCHQAQLGLIQPAVDRRLDQLRVYAALEWAAREGHDPVCVRVMKVHAPEGTTIYEAEVAAIALRAAQNYRGPLAIFTDCQSGVKALMSLNQSASCIEV